MVTHFHKKPNLYTSHVQLKVSNLERSIEFYTTIIGFQLLEQTATTAYLTVDGKTSLISLIEVQEAVSQQGFTGLYGALPFRITITNANRLRKHYSTFHSNKHTSRCGGS